MKKIRKGTAVLLLLLSLCVPAVDVSADVGNGLAEYTVEYIARDGETETLLARETYRAPAGRTVNVPHREFDNYVKEAGQDMTLPVAADGKAEKKIYYTRLFYDRITFRTEGSYILPIYGCAGEDVSDMVSAVGEPVRQGYIFKGWDRDLPDVMPEGDYVLNAVWEPGESQYTVLRWMENAEDDGYTLLGEKEIRTAETGSTVTASEEDIERAGEMADWFPDSEYYGDYYGFDYARCDDAVVTADGKAVLNLYYDREIWTINLHEEADHESGSSDSLIPNDDIWYTAQGKYGAALPEDFPSYDEMEKHYMEKTQHQDMEFLGVRDEFEATGRHLDSFYFQDLALGNHTFDAYPWLERDSYTVYLTYFKESSDGTYRKVRQESVRVDKDPAVYGAEVTVLHPKGLTCEEGWYTTGTSPEACEQGAKIPISPLQIQADGKCVFRGVSSHLYIYMKRDTFQLNYLDVNEQGESTVLYTEEVTYRDDVTLEYVPDAEAGHQNDRFTGWYLSPALTASGTPLGGFRMPSDDVSVYAGWTAADRTVQFDVRADDAEITGAPADQSVRAGECAKEPDDPERAGYIFLGWFEEPSEKAGDADGGIPDTRAAWDFGRPVEKDMTLYAGWIPERDTLYTIRHMNAGSEEPFYEEAGTGNSGDRIIIQPLDPSDPAYPGDAEADAAQRFAVLEKDKLENVYTIIYKKKDVSVSERPEAPEVPEKPETPEILEKSETMDVAGIPDTGDRAHVVERLAMAAAAVGSGWIVLLCIRRICAKLV